MSHPAPRPLSQAQAGVLQSAFGLLQEGQLDRALSLAQGLAAQAPFAPDAQHLLAMTHARRGAFDQAEQAFRKSLQLAPGQPMILCNYAAMLQGRHRPAEALVVARQAARAAPQSTRAWWLAGHAALETEALDIALESFNALVALSPDNLSARVQLSVVLRKLGRPEDAVAALAAVMGHGGDDGVLADAMTGALVDAQRADDAITVAREALQSHPQNVTIVSTLAHLLWEHAETDGGGSAALLMFEQRLAQQPDNRGLRIAFARFLLDAREPAAAMAQLLRLRAAQDDPTLALLQARAHDMLDETGLAGEIYARLDQGGRETSPTFLNAYATHLLQARNPEHAEAVAARVLASLPDDQHAWAVRATAWRMQGDARANWLCDADTLVGIVDIEPPAAFADRDAFLSALVRCLEPLHGARREPMQQSLRGGSQTPGRLFGRADPVLEATRTALVASVERWLGSLPQDRSHPFLRRNTARVRMGGSWSVKLRSSGQHANHMHSDGWMSSAFYVALPPSVLQAATPAGALQFGQPPVELGLTLPPTRVVHPQPGRLVLFPSYMWHGTVPFADEQPRMTIAFDMLPLQEQS